MKNKLISVIKIIFMVMSYYLLVKKGFHLNLIPSNDVNIIYGTYLVTIILVSLLIIKVSGVKVFSGEKITPKKLIKEQLLYVIFFVLYLSTMYVMTIMFGELPPSINQEGLDVVTQVVHPIISFSVIGIFGPIVEELVFRHVLIKEVHHVFPKIPISILAIINTFIFAYLHVVKDVDKILPYLILSSYYVWRYVKNDKHLGYSIFPHVTNNCVGQLLSHIL